MSLTKTEKQKEAEWLDAAMRARGWENRDLARESGLDANWISQWKIANRPIPDLALFKLAKLFGVSPFAVRPSLREYEQFFLKSSPLDGLSDTDQGFVLRMIEGLRAASKGINVTTGDRKPELTIVDKERK